MGRVSSMPLLFAQHQGIWSKRGSNGRIGFMAIGEEIISNAIENGATLAGKDAAVLAGFGCIGKNNLLITPTHGPRIRLRALFLYSEIDPTGPIAFDPCAGCKVHCRRVCPENAMDQIPTIFKAIEFPEQLPGRDGTYSRQRCNKRMEKDVSEGSKRSFGKQPTTKFCRKCELVCPVGKR